ncbi:MAG: glycine-rich domain-containing protein [Verrucomicrobiales bacterium]
MDASEQELYQRIEAVSIDTGGEALTFRSRLARENGWAPGYAARLLDEYKRFVFLAMVAGHPVTPSDQVDQAWHLHLAYTRRGRRAQSNSAMVAVAPTVMVTADAVDVEVGAAGTDSL